MFRCLIILVTLLGSLNLLSGTAYTSDPQIAAALTFTFDGRTHVAVFDEDGVQWVGVLPSLMLFGRYDMLTIAPEWTADGRLIGTGYDPMGDFDREPKYEAPATYLQSYDIHSATFMAFDTPIAPPLPASPDGFAPPQILTSNSLSLDGNYATFFDVLQASGHLVDLQNGETLFNRGCSFKALIWEPERVLLGTYGIPNEDCPPFLAWVDLNTGEVMVDFGEIVAQQQVFRFDHALILDDHLLVYIIVGDGSHILGLIEGDTYRILVRSDKPIWIAPDNSGVVFSDDASLVYMPLEDPFAHDNITDLPTSQMPQIIFNEAGFIAWGNDNRYDGLGIIDMNRAIYEPGAGTSSPDLLYQGDIPHRRAFSPDLVYAAILNEGHVQVFAAQLQQVWSSTDSGLTSDMSNDAVLYWADKWRIVTELRDYAGSMVGDLESGATVPPPEPGARLINISPDGRWWLYLVPETVEYQFEFRGHRLIAYDSTTSEMHVIKDAIADGDDARFLLVEGHEFIWWTPH